MLPRLIPLFFILLVAIPFVTAETKGYIYLTIIDPAPQIKNLTITEPIYPFSKIECNAEVIDNDPANVRLEYKWYVNENLFSEADYLSGSEVQLEAGQEVRCDVVAYDSREQASEIASAKTIVQKLSVFGITTYAIKNLNDTGKGIFSVLLLLLLISIGTSLRRK